MARKKKKPSKYFYSWGVEKYGRPAFWHKSSWRDHVDRHERLLTDEEKFAETLADPDVIFTDDQNAESCYYKINAFEEVNTTFHAKVVIVENSNLDTPPTKGKYVIIKSAREATNMPEEQSRSMKIKFDKRKSGK
jgi:hypothetical protein